MRRLEQPPALLYFVVLAFPAAAILVANLAGSEPKAHAQWFDAARWFCGGAFGVSFAVWMFIAMSQRNQPVVERTEELQNTAFLLALLFAFDFVPLALASTPALSLPATAVGVAWILAWCWPPFRRTSFMTSYVVQRSPDVVFAFIADKRNLPKWWSEYDSVELLTPEPIGAGSRFRASVRIPPDGRRFVADVELLDFEPNRRLTSYVSTGHQPNGDEYTFQPFESGTLVSYRFDFEHSLSAAALGAVPLQFVPNGLQRAMHERAQARIKQILGSAPL